MQETEKDKSLLYLQMYPVCCELAAAEIWQKLVDDTEGPESFTDALRENMVQFNLPEYLAELAEMERYVFRLKTSKNTYSANTEKLTVNPTLHLFINTWKNLSSLINAPRQKISPEKGEEQVIVWHHPASGRIKAKAATEEDLLVLKIALEGLTSGEVAQQGNTHEAAINGAIIRALDEGFITGPESRITRDYISENTNDSGTNFTEARIFSLQWHITQTCDLHCRHCYDRDQYASLPLRDGISMLDSLAEFCRSHNVHGQVTFTGGNPLLHPDFDRLNSEAANRGFTTAILGNPAPRDVMEKIIAVQPPAFYQVSLEGLEEHNDYMRGKGHFQRILTFLDLLREMGIFSMVMLTLTRENMDQVLPLAEILRNRTNLFTFNRLSLFGEGANLVMASPEDFPGFLKQYTEAAPNNPCLGMKDNLLNIVNHQEGKPLFGGCTGHGCGAAFNFISVLANGEVHACRKFPSPIGNIMNQSLDEIYHSKAAKRYRSGPEECHQCSLRPVCRGCLASAYSHGLDIFSQKDPYCFIEEIDM